MKNSNSTFGSQNAELIATIEISVNISLAKMGKGGGGGG
jgi:hypothetical protein